MGGLVSAELQDNFNLDKIINYGYLPRHYILENSKEMIHSYVLDYLKEEVINEGLVRNLPMFSDFLRAAALGDTEMVNLSNIARECGVALTTVKEHYAILEDTMLGSFVPAFTLRPKRRTVQAPKFYFFDVGVVNNLAQRGVIKSGSELFGKAFENFIFHELSNHSKYSNEHYKISYWRLSSGIEVDFIIGNAEIAIEVKGKSKISTSDYNGLLQFREEYPNVKKLILIADIPRARKTVEGIEILPYREFLEKLWNNAFSVTRPVSPG